MKSLVVALLCLFTYALAVPVNDTRIVGGNPADMYSHPHQASLQYSSSGSYRHICGAVIITEYKLLTAAHCVDGLSASLMRVQVGVVDLYNGPFTYRQTRSLSYYVKHPYYNGNANGFPNDIAVLTISQKLNYNNNVQPATLAPPNYSFAGSECVISGWGRTSGSSSQGASTLKEAYMSKITNSQCRQYWGSSINNGHICIYAQGGVSACSGDSGGPMMCGSGHHLLAGVTSWGLSSCSACATGFPKNDSRIVGGDPAVLYAHPHQASLQYSSGGGYVHICGAVIVSQTKLLTAAHCVDGLSSNSMRVQVGVLDLYDGPFTYLQTRSLAYYVKHPNYNGNANGFPNDIAVLTLSSSISYNNNVQKADLAPVGYNFEGTDCLITGWGKTHGSGSGASTLKEAQMTMLTQSQCQSYWGFSINSGHICVFAVGGVSACSGDSGGPMMCGSGYHYLTGITSWGASSCTGSYPSVYTSTAAYNSWINNNI